MKAKHGVEPESGGSAEDDSGLIGSIKRVFGRGEAADARSARQASGANSAASKRRPAYLEQGVYSARQELAAVAALISDRAGQEAPMPRGPAYFAAKDTRNKPAESRDIATSPEEIRRKLDRRQSPEGGGASFKGKDMESIGDVSETAEHEAGDIAQTAERFARNSPNGRLPARARRPSRAKTSTTRTSATRHRRRRGPAKNLKSPHQPAAKPSSKQKT